MDQYFMTNPSSRHTCKCSHEAFEHIDNSDHCGYDGPCNIKLCRCNMYDPYIIFISEKTNVFKSMDYLFYNIGVNLIPANYKKMSYNALLDAWINSPLSDSTFEFWKKKGYFYKGKKKLNYGIILRRIHRGINKGRLLSSIDIHFDIEKGTTFLPLYRDRRQDTSKQHDLILKRENYENESS